MAATYEDSRDEDNHLELEGHRHALTIDKSEGVRWLAFLTIWPKGRWGDGEVSALITPDDARAVVDFLSRLLSESERDGEK